jgi:hypothetical protein
MIRSLKLPLSSLHIQITVILRAILNHGVHFCSVRVLEDFYERGNSGSKNWRKYAEKNNIRRNKNTKKKRRTRPIPLYGTYTCLHMYDF